MITQDFGIGEIVTTALQTQHKKYTVFKKKIEEEEAVARGEK
jgi:hypothetical protein